MLTQGYSCWQLASASHTAVAGISSVSRKKLKVGRVPILYKVPKSRVSNFVILYTTKKMSTEQRLTLSNTLRKYTSFQSNIAIILCSLISAYQSARCHISEDNNHRCGNRKHRSSGTFTSGAQNDFSLSLLFGRASVERWKDKRQKYLPSRACTFNVCHMVLKKYPREEIIFKSVSQKCKCQGIGSLFDPPTHTKRDYGRRFKGTSTKPVGIYFKRRR